MKMDHAHHGDLLRPVADFPAQSRQTQAKSVGTSQQRLTVLLVEANRKFAEIVTSLLQQYGFDAIHAETIEAALVTFKSDAVEVLITELGWPPYPNSASKGIQFIEELRNSDYSSPIIALTGIRPLSDFEVNRLFWDLRVSIIIKEDWQLLPSTLPHVLSGYYIILYDWVVASLRNSKRIGGIGSGLTPHLAKICLILYENRDLIYDDVCRLLPSKSGRPLSRHTLKVQVATICEGLGLRSRGKKALVTFLDDHPESLNWLRSVSGAPGRLRAFKLPPRG